jgi:hypothetical protein
MKPISFWVPATVCAVISIGALIGALLGQYSNLLRAVFYGFLPVCFFFVGSIMYRMHREISRLRHRVARLEQTQQKGAQRAEWPSGSSDGTRAVVR